MSNKTFPLIFHNRQFEICLTEAFSRKKRQYAPVLRTDQESSPSDPDIDTGGAELIREKTPRTVILVWAGTAKIFSHGRKFSKRRNIAAPKLRNFPEDRYESAMTGGREPSGFEAVRPCAVLRNTP